MQQHDIRAPHLKPYTSLLLGVQDNSAPDNLPITLLHDVAEICNINEATDVGVDTPVKDVTRTRNLSQISENSYINEEHDEYAHSFLYYSLYKRPRWLDREQLEEGEESLYKADVENHVIIVSHYPDEGLVALNFTETGRRRIV